MILVVSKPAQAIIENLDRDTARQVIDFFAMLRSAQDQQELEKVFPGCIDRLGGDFHWFARLNEQCKIVLAFDHNDHKEPIALVLNVLDSHPLKPMGLKGYLVNASRWASKFLTRTANVSKQPQGQSSPACNSQPQAGGEALNDMLRRAVDEQRAAARELQSRQNLQRGTLTASPPLSTAERIARDFGNLGDPDCR